VKYSIYKGILEDKIIHFCGQECLMKSLNRLINDQEMTDRYLSEEFNIIDVRSWA